MGVAGSLVVAAATGVSAALSGIQSEISTLREHDLSDLRKEIAVLRATFDEAAKSSMVIAEMRYSMVEDQNKNMMIEIDRIKHNIDMIAARIAEQKRR